MRDFALICGRRGLVAGAGRVKSPKLLVQIRLFEKPWSKGGDSRLCGGWRLFSCSMVVDAPGAEVKGIRELCQVAGIYRNPESSRGRGAMAATRKGREKREEGE